MRAFPVVVLSGAGISRESGLDTFRDKGGIWDRYDPQKVASVEGWRQNPDLVQEFYNMRRSELLNDNIQPNAAHLALAKLQQRWQAPCTIVTQNIDDLHERACKIFVSQNIGQNLASQSVGDKADKAAGGDDSNIVHIHGETLRSLCSLCDARARCEENLSAQSVCQACSAAGECVPMSCGSAKCLTSCHSSISCWNNATSSSRWERRAPSIPRRVLSPMRVLPVR